VSLHLASAADLLRRPDGVKAWSHLDRITRKVIGWRMEHGRTPETDEELDKLMLLRAWTARRLVN
jgi:hypothetical protein